MSHLLKKELQNNHLKLTKWGVSSYLAGVEKIKIGFVTRKNIKSNSDHIVVGFYDVNSNDILQVTNFNKNIAWGIVRQLIELVRNQADGTFILMKMLATTGPKSMVKLYKIPGDAQEENDQEENDQEGQDY
jgi:translation initiation factor 3 subunit D